ncbi:hypothetical protein WMY93_027765 [Mugilogobius chulae]|uniref:Bassoon presynaptic cytomatrix protein n=1 Tax=Mugilogobius chulae TaxID=88201 RepID=A0AAW0MZP2_9GOBI
MYPAAIRSADGMIYSTIQTPIASTLPITTQPASVLRPLLRGTYRPFASPSMTPVPLSSLTRLPMSPRMPLSGATPVRYPTPGLLQTTTATDTPPAISTVAAPVSAPVSVAIPPTTSAVQEEPVYLGKAHLNSQKQAATTQQAAVQAPLAAHAYPPSQAPIAPPGGVPVAGGLPQFPPPGAVHKEGETEAERLHRQQEQLLQMERERVELEKLRQLRLQEELERERIELKLHREKEQMLVQRELQELQSIKEQNKQLKDFQVKTVKQVFQQQQHEREKQLVLQREQLAQQKSQLDQIQSLQQQLQQQLEEQKRQKTAQVDSSGQPVHPYMDSSHAGSRSLPNSSSEICLRSQEEQLEARAMRKHSSMTRLSRDDGDVHFYGTPRRAVDSCVQTDDEDTEERYMMRPRSRRRGRSVDCSVQTDDDEDKVETEHPVRRRRSRYSRHAETTGTTPSTATVVPTEAKVDKTVSSSIAIQTIREMSCQTEVEHLGRVSPAIHVTVPDPNKVEIVHYISGPERTQKGQSLACQTDPEAQSQGVVAPQLSVPTTVSPYSTSTSSGTQQSSEILSQRQQQQIAANAAKFERRRPDPLDINYQPHNHIHNESISSIIRQQQSAPKSPQVLYSPVSPVSPHRLLETSLSSERLNKAHVTPQQKSYTAESPQRHPSVPRPIKSTQRSMTGSKSQPLKDLTHELKAVEQESTKLRKQQAELEEEEKEIDAKLRYLELGIHQRKETLVYGDTRDYMSDSELNNLRLAASGVHDSNGLLTTRPSTAPLSQFPSDLNTAAQYPPTSSYMSCQYPQSQPQAPTQPSSVPYQSSTYNPPPYPTGPNPRRYHSQRLSRLTPPPLDQHTSLQPHIPHTRTPSPAPIPQTELGIPAAPQPRLGTPQLALPPLLRVNHHTPPTAHHIQVLSMVGIPLCHLVLTDNTPQAQLLLMASTPQLLLILMAILLLQLVLMDSILRQFPMRMDPVDSPSTYSTADAMYGGPGLEQNIPRNYMMCDDVTENLQVLSYRRARDVEADLAAYTAATAGGGAFPSSQIRGRQLIEDYGFKRSTFDSSSTDSGHISRYYRSMFDEDDRIYYTSTGRSRSHGYRSRSYERDDRSYRSGYSRGRHPTRQYSEEESPLSPMGRFISSRRSSSLGPDPYEGRSSRFHYYYGQYGSSHSLPDVQDHIRDLPRTHVYKSDDTYLIDDYHCAVLPFGQEETDWFEKPRSSSRHYGSHSSSRSRGHGGVKHTYHDYDEPPEEDLWPQDEYGHSGRHTSSRDHRHHGSSGRHSSSRHADEHGLQGSKAAPRPGGIGSAAAGVPGMEGEGMFSKILPGGAAEQAGKLGRRATEDNLRHCTRAAVTFAEFVYLKTLKRGETEATETRAEQADHTKPSPPQSEDCLHPNLLLQPKNPTPTILQQSLVAVSNFHDTETFYFPPLKAAKL